MPPVEEAILVGALALFVLIVAFREKKPSPLYVFAFFLGAIGLAARNGLRPAEEAPYCLGIAVVLGLAGVSIHWRR